MQSQAKTVAAYLKELPPERRAAISAVRELVLANVDRDRVEERMGYGMIGWDIPHRVFPQGYHCNPSLGVPYIGLASQKQYMSLYLMTVYGGNEEERFLREGFAKAGLRIDLGKCCLRFKRLEDLDLEVLAALIRRVPVLEYLRRYVASVPAGAWKRSSPRTTVVTRTAAKKAASTKTPAKRAAAGRTATKRTATKRTATKRPAAKRASTKRPAAKRK